MSQERDKLDYLQETLGSFITVVAHAIVEQSLELGLDPVETSLERLSRWDQSLTEIRDQTVQDLEYLLRLRHMLEDMIRGTADVAHLNPAWTHLFDNGRQRPPQQIPMQAVGSLLAVIATCIVERDHQENNPLAQDFRERMQRLLPAAADSPDLSPAERPYLLLLAAYFEDHLAKWH